MNDVNFNFVNSNLAIRIESNLLGTPTENRVLIAVSNTEKVTNSGIFIPSTAKEDIPRKGVIVQKGITNDDRVHELLNIGDIVTFGLYGGKEVYPTFNKKNNDIQIEELKDIKFFVLSTSEIIYVEPNK